MSWLRKAVDPRSTLGTGLVPLLVLPALFAAAVGVSGTFLEPDASSYTGGIALFPSPLGTVIGTVGGYVGLVVVNVLATFAIGVLVGVIARHVGSNPVVAQALMLAIAPSGWFREWGMDAPGAALLVGAALAHVRGRAAWTVTLVVLASLVHLAALPLGLGALALQCVTGRGVTGRRVSLRGALAAAAVGGLGLALMLGTGYRAGLAVVEDPGAVIEGVREVFSACWPLLLLLPFAAPARGSRGLVVGSLLGAVVAGAIPAAVGQVGIVRYAVPCVFLAMATLEVREGLPFSRLTRQRAAGGRSEAESPREPGPASA